MINGEHLTELIKQAQKAQAEFDALVRGVDFRQALQGIIYSKTLTGDIFAIRDPETPEDYKLEALERIARRYFSFKRIYGRERREIIRDGIKERINTADYTWLNAWQDIVIAEIYIAISSGAVDNTPVKQVFYKARNILRASIEIELFGKTLDSERENRGGKRKVIINKTRPLYDSDEKRLFEGNFRLINMAGDYSKQNARVRFYTGSGLEDRAIEIDAIRNIIAAVGVKDVDFFLTQYKPESQPPELQPPKDQWPLINDKIYKIKKEIIAAARRLGYQ